ncbi:hypothetical protein [Streptomyces hydrogenans]|uniref:hypothetical protein n=1 Tax=Streptomyces hydrogenans TaxID=1873719 RepID=UPI0038098AE2
MYHQHSKKLLVSDSPNRPVPLRFADVRGHDAGTRSSGPRPVREVPVADRVIGFLFILAFFACVAAFLARAAQGLELWAQQTADITVETRVRTLAHLPASMTRTLATVVTATATTAALLAAFYAWGRFGSLVQERANTARDNAAAHAARARAATRRS